MSRPPERRLRLRRKDEVSEGLARMNPKTMEQLQIKDKIEVVIAGKKKGVWSVLASESVSENEVWMNSEELRRRGIADNTIATVRRPLTQG